MRIVFQYHAGPLSSYFEMTSIVTPGDGANIGGSPMTGVAGPSGCVRSTTFNAPRRSSSTSRVSTPLMAFPVSSTLWRGGLTRRLTRGDPSLESKAVFRQLQVHAVVVRADGGDLGDHDAEAAARERVDRRLAELHHRIDGRDVLDSRGTRHSRQIGDARRGMRVEPTGREQAAVVEHEVDEVCRPVPRQRRERSEIHQQRTVAVEDHDALVRQMYRKAEAHRRCEAHRVL